MLDILMYVSQHRSMMLEFFTMTLWGYLKSETSPATVSNIKKTDMAPENREAFTTHLVLVVCRQVLLEVIDR